MSDKNITPSRKRDPFGESFCRGCGVPLMPENARISRDHFVGACRACEALEAHRRKGWRTFYTDGRRKYPVPASERTA